MKYIVEVDKSGNRFWKNFKTKKLHREDGPAYEWADGTKQWYLNGQWHREDGPAYEDADGTKFWCLNDKLHREDGPAYEGADGTKEWYLNGKLHREDGPAIERARGTKYWYLNGKNLTEEEFNKKMKKPCKIDGEIIKIKGIKYKLTKV
jgi:endo-1,4-beta-mannosidase